MNEKIANTSDCPECCGSGWKPCWQLATRTNGRFEFERISEDEYRSHTADKRGSGPYSTHVLEAVEPCHCARGEMIRHPPEPVPAAKKPAKSQQGRNMHDGKLRASGA